MRCVGCETDISFLAPISFSTQVELWDCGGGEHQSSCWPAIQRGAQVGDNGDDDGDDDIDILGFNVGANGPASICSRLSTI